MDNQQQQLTTIGYLIIPKAIKISNKILYHIRKQSLARGKPIFGKDQKRKQCALYLQRNIVKDFIAELNHQVEQIINPEYHQQSKWVILRSDPGCLQQPYHQDYVPSEELNACPDDQFPLGIICALMPGTTLNVFSLDSGEESLVELSTGDLLVFRGDLIHAGSAYQNVNYRLHCYVDSNNVKRKANPTHIIKSLRKN